MEKHINILLVDDHQIVLDGIKSMLNGHPLFKVVATALTGKQAWSLIQAAPHAYHLVITDISMPDINGIDLCRRIKEQYDNLSVLILSMHHETTYIKSAIACEANGYLLKICGQKEFIRALESIMDTGYYFAYDILPIIRSETKQATTNDQHNLTSREMEVLTLILQEFTSREIAERLYISKQTVDTHRIRIMEKTSSKSVVGLIKYAIRHRLIN